MIFQKVHYKEEENREFLQLMVIYWEKNVNKIFTKQRDINIANAVIEQENQNFFSSMEVRLLVRYQNYEKNIFI